MILSDPVTDIPMVGPSYAKKLIKLDIHTVGDLLHHPPTRYVDYSQTSPIKGLRAGEQATITGQVTFIKNSYTKAGKNIQIATISDGESTIPAVWFNQYFIVRALPVGTLISLSGKVNFWNKKLAFMFPEYEKISNENSKTIHTGGLIPIYSETAGLSSKWLRHKINLALNKTDIKDFLVEKVSIKQALNLVHHPQKLEDIETGRQRLAYNELLTLQIESRLKKLKWQTQKISRPLPIKTNQLEKFISSLPFILTKSQTRSINEITEDLSKKIPMNRLLEGDVGSGKTIVAAAAAFAAFVNSKQTVYLAPTQILASQHYETMKEIFKPFNMRVELITSKIKKLEIGRTDLFVGTHALLNQKFQEALGLLIIDEQHRFGVKQRAKLTEKKLSPHILTMTATPIPRTVALTLYADLSLSTLDEMPKGRQKVITWIVPPKKRAKAYQWIKQEINKHKSQAFVVCPLIEESESEKMTEVKAATVEFKKIKKALPNLNIAILHGRLKAEDKEKIIQKFKDGKSDILVSTPVVEVGIDIPNATIMLIEAADRFGLAQLHQLRGRVGRGSKKSYCLLFTQNQSPKVRVRLEALKKHTNGRKLAELDLHIRGAGEIFGTRQHGASELKFAHWTDIGLIKKSRQLAEDITKNQSKHMSLIKHFKSLPIAEN